MNHNSCQIHGHINRKSHLHLLKLIVLAALIMFSIINACYGFSVLAAKSGEMACSQQNGIEVVAMLRN